MVQRCLHCGAAIHDPDRVTCPLCGKPLPGSEALVGSPTAQPEPVASPASPPVKAGKSAAKAEPVRVDKPRRGRGCVGCLRSAITLLLLLLIAVVAAYYFLLRPQVEQFVLARISGEIQAMEPWAPYDGGLAEVAIPEEDLNRSVVLPPDVARIVTTARIDLQPDRVVLEMVAFGVPTDVSGEISAAEDGTLLFHDMRAGWVASLFLSPLSLQEVLTRDVNQYWVEPSNIDIVAVEVTEREIRMALKEENQDR